MNDQHGAMRAVEPGDQHQLAACVNAAKPRRYVRLEYQPRLRRPFIRLSRRGREVLQLRFDLADRFEIDTHLYYLEGTRDWGLGRDAITSKETCAAVQGSRPSPVPASC